VRARLARQVVDAGHGQGSLKNQIWLQVQIPRRDTTTRHPEETMQFKHVTLDIDSLVAILTLDHQEVMNAVSVDMLGGLGEALDAIDGRKAEVR
jgi:hypothetical protein